MAATEQKFWKVRIGLYLDNQIKLTTEVYQNARGLVVCALRGALCLFTDQYKRWSVAKQKHQRVAIGTDMSDYSHLLFDVPQRFTHKN
uniref:Uncharacterized protein n=1 Tax=Magallana gigas TaxID=29159 RepID=K1PPE7_MAGGI